MSIDVYQPPQTPLEVDEGRPVTDNADLADMDFKAVKRLRNASHSIRALGAIWVLSATVMLLALADVAQSGNVPIAIQLVLLLFMAMFIVAVYAAWLRPSWGRGAVIAVCILITFNIGLGTILGILGLLAAVPSSSKRLFGPMRFTHGQVVARFRELKRQRKYGITEPASSEQTEPSQMPEGEDSSAPSAPAAVDEPNPYRS